VEGETTLTEEDKQKETITFEMPATPVKLIGNYITVN